MRKYPRLGSCLMNGRPCLHEDRDCLSVTFAKDKEFQVNSIAGDCATLEEIVAAIFGRKLKVELKLGESGQVEAVREEIRQEVAPTHKEELDQACKKDKSLDDLVNMMGGQPLPDSDRERWDIPGDSE